MKVTKIARIYLIINGKNLLRVRSQSRNRSRQMPFSNAVIASKESKHLRKNWMSSDSKDINHKSNYRSSVDLQSNEDIFKNKLKTKSVFRNSNIMNSQINNRDVHTTSPQYYCVFTPVSYQSTSIIVFIIFKYKNNL